MVLTPLSSVDDKRTPWVTVEDKRLEVFTTHCEEFRSYASQARFPWPETALLMKGATPGLRMWIQIWGQMEEYKVDFGNIFSPTGVTYVRRQPDSDELFFSQIYTTLNQEVRCTTCLILEAREQAERPRPQAKTVAGTVVGWLRRNLWAIVIPWLINWKLRASLLWNYLRGLNGIYILYHRTTFFGVVRDSVCIASRISPSLFTMVVGHGASGTVWRSENGTDVVKIFEDSELTFHEATVLKTARGLAVPRVRGVVSDGEETEVVMSYTGTPIESIERAPDNQKQQLAQTLVSLHAIGIHHHDVRTANVLIDNRGALALIDFDQAEFVHGSCIGCPDIDILTVLDCP
ncbi:hypothetical protein DFH09DRAFT_1501527 [Mycena vulgaris]|nr:hypothetical protein DFH09DRAFT_1501527 [Mycena vulgaris]